MKLDISKLNTKQQGVVEIGDVYLAKGGGGTAKHPTKYWCVIAVTDHRISVIGFDAAGDITTTANYLRHAVEGRQFVGRAIVGIDWKVEK